MFRFSSQTILTILPKFRIRIQGLLKYADRSLSLSSVFMSSKILAKIYSGLTFYPESIYIRDVYYQGYYAWKVKCSCVYMAYILKPVFFVNKNRCLRVCLVSVEDKSI